MSDTVYFETPEAYIQLRSYSEPFLQMSDSSVFIPTSSEHPVVTCHPVNHRSHSTVTHTQTGNWRTCGGKPAQTTGEHAPSTQKTHFLLSHGTFLIREGKNLRYKYFTYFGFSCLPRKYQDLGATRVHPGNTIECVLNRNVFTCSLKKLCRVVFTAVLCAIMLTLMEQNNSHE